MIGVPSGVIGRNPAQNSAREAGRRLALDYRYFVTRLRQVVRRRRADYPTSQDRYFHEQILSGRQALSSTARAAMH
jgi:hypothetical protein